MALEYFQTIIHQFKHSLIQKNQAKNTIVSYTVLPRLEGPPRLARPPE